MENSQAKPKDKVVNPPRSTRLSDPDAAILGMVCAAPTERELQEAIGLVLEVFKEYTTIMTSEAALVLPKHGPYNHTIELKEGAVPPWGSICLCLVVL